MKKITLYIIDDEEEVVRALKAGLRSKRFQIRAHTSVADLWEDVERCPPQVVICDQTMPECEGLELLRRLKERFPEMRSILLTAHELDERVMTELMEGTMDLYMGKPWNLAELEQAAGKLARLVSKSATAPLE